MRQTGDGKGFIPLDIALDYPINWSFRLVLRDLIQNFYDAAGRDRFEEEFTYNWYLSGGKDTYDLEMSLAGHPFSYEWLTYIGGSTKTGNASTFVGQYGEGFKMCALRIVQLGNMELCMHSQDWQIRPMVFQKSIDGQNILMLGYSWEQVENDGLTVLKLSGIPLSERKNLQNALLDYCYEGNLLAGEKIGEGADYCVWKRSDVPIPCDQNDSKFQGVLYLNHLARGRLDIPLVIDYLTKIGWDRRSRPTLSPADTYTHLVSCMRLWSADLSAKVLWMLEPFWNEMLSSKYDVDSKYYLICQLVRNVVQDRETAAGFSEKMQECAYIEKKGSDLKRNRQIAETRRWFSKESGKQLVNPIFRLLGAENLVETYVHKEDGLYTEPNPVEKRRYMILKEAVRKVVLILEEKDFPEFVVIRKDDHMFDPLQFSERAYGSIKKRNGRKYRINKLAMLKKDFEDDSFNLSFIKLADAVLHIYGTSRSVKLNGLLTYMGRYVLEGSEILDRYESQWKKIKNT